MIYKNYFDIDEFFIDKELRDSYADIPVHVVNKIINHHLPILNDVRDKMNAPVWISKNSGYRSVQWELDHGRSGTSEHTFRGDGAVDVTARNMQLLLKYMMESDYKRICYYPEQGFIHADQKGTNYHYFEANPQGVWTYKGKRKK